MFEPKRGSYALANSVCEECDEEYLDEFPQPVFVSPPSCDTQESSGVSYFSSSKGSSGRTTPIPEVFQPELFSDGGGTEEEYMEGRGGKEEQKGPRSGDDSELTFNR